METLCHLPPDRQTRVFFNEWCSTKYGGVRYLAVEGGGGVRPALRPYPPSLLPPEPVLFPEDDGIMFLSTCAMQDVTEMTLCRDTTSRHVPIMGILFRHHHDRTTCVGQFRFDMPLEVVPLDAKAELYICLRRTETRRSYVAIVQTHPPEGQTGPQWIHISRHGVLEWWFSGGVTRIYARPS